MSKEAIQNKINEFNERYEGQSPTPLNVCTFLTAWVNQLLGVTEGENGSLCVLADIYPSGDEIPVGIGEFKRFDELFEKDEQFLKERNTEIELKRLSYETEQEAQQ